MKKAIALVLFALFLIPGTAIADDTMSADVVVVGAGGAGLAAAIEASSHDAEVILLEKLPFAGGSTLVSGGGLVAAGTRIQEEAGIDDSPDALVEDWMAEQEYGRDEFKPADEDFVRRIAEKGYEITAWLEDHVGVEFREAAGLGRYHAPKDGRGEALVAPMQETALEQGVNLMTETEAVRLLTDDDGTVIGVEAADAEEQKIEIEAPSVILATGGFPQNQELMEEFVPEAAHSATYSTVGATGDGLIMARDIGADIIESAWVIGYVGLILEDRAYYDPVNNLAWDNNLHVNTQGERFGDESLPYYRYFVEKAQDGDDLYFLIYDDDNADRERMQMAIDEGVAWQADTLEELAEQSGIDCEGLKATAEQYNAMAEAGADEQFGKAAEHLEKVDNPPYFAVRMLPNNIGTMGGPRIDLDGRVLDTDGDVIQGLYAAGEVANKQFYQDMYVGGSAIAVAVTMGRITGEKAVTDVE